MKNAKILTILVLAIVIVFWAKVSEAAPLGTAFTYQGHRIVECGPALGSDVVQKPMVNTVTAHVDTDNAVATNSFCLCFSCPRIIQGNVACSIVEKTVVGTTGVIVSPNNIVAENAIYTGSYAKGTRHLKGSTALIVSIIEKNIASGGGNKVDTNNFVTGDTF